MPTSKRVQSMVYCGCLRPGTTSQKRFETLTDLADQVWGINTAFPPLFEHLYFRTDHRFDFLNLNFRLASLCRRVRPDVVWFDKATKVRPSTLQQIKQGGATLVHINPDDPFGAFNRGWSLFLDAISRYDLHFVARPINIQDYLKHGALCVHGYDRSFDPNFHRPLKGQPGLPHDGAIRIGFVGSWAPKRSDSLAYLVGKGMALSIWGDGWRRQKNWNILEPFYCGEGAYGNAYVERLNSLDIVLHFLRAENRDEQDSRTYEIPGCGRFMLAERSPKHSELFKEGEEAEFFENNDELLAKVLFYAGNPSAMRAVAERGHYRAVNNYTHKHRLSGMLEIAQARRSSDLFLTATTEHSRQNIIS
jgi:spore maturation protein CgeB